MSGNLWMFSDKLDDEDIEILKHEFITYYQGADYYGLGLKMFTRLAHEAGAVYKIGKKVLIRRTIFDAYLRKLYHINQEEAAQKEVGNKKFMKQGPLVRNDESGRMDIRFGLNEYCEGLRCGTRLDVLIDLHFTAVLNDSGESAQSRRNGCSISAVAARNLTRNTQGSAANRQGSADRK